jgi:D-xylose transport system permease protein
VTQPTVDPASPGSEPASAGTDPVQAAAPLNGGVDSDLLVAAAPELLADSLGEYVRAWGKRIRSGESGALPIILGLAVIVVIFQSEQSKFLSAGNLVNLLVQGAFFILLGLAELFALLLSEIDLSIAFVGAVGGTITAALASPAYGWPWSGCWPARP